MDPTLLPGMPAPFWFVQFFKVVGFVLHLIPMGLWFAGLPIAILCGLWNCEHSRRYARRMFGQFPIIMALGINFGIVPLLFLQTTYYKSFYTATILMAWHWIAVIPILIVGYYALYLAAFSRRNENDPQRSGRTLFYGIIASVCLIAIGILISNGLTLMVRSDLWNGIMERTNYYGATTGVANNMRDSALWIRFATMFGLGLLTVSVWAVVDSHLLLRNRSAVAKPDEFANNGIALYRRWTTMLAVLLSVLGAAVLTATEWVVKTGNGGENIAIAYPYFGWIVLSAFLVFVSLLMAKLVTRHSGKLVTVAVLFHVLTLAGFGIIRQIGQNAGVGHYVDVAKIPTNIQWSPLLAFLLVFVAGLVVIAWMIKQAASISPQHQENHERNTTVS